jgi:hypothetical protein
VAGGRAAPTSDAASIEARLARVESLIDADLEKLGPAVLAESIAALDAQIEALRERVAGIAAAGQVARSTAPADGKDDQARAITALGRRIAGLEQALSATVDANARTDQQLAELIERLDRLTAGLLG